MAKAENIASPDVQKHYQYILNENRPDKAFTSNRAKKAGKANASSGQIFITVPPDHFGPILAANDPKKNRGVVVGDEWGDRLDCRQSGVHRPHVAGIAGQSEYGAQSVALSGGYQDDEDHGEWFLYTGSGGRDLSGNKRTNKDQSFDQKFDKSNEALRVSCKKGYPVRVVRSHKEKRSSYAPVSGVRYDGIYRIESCWRKVGIQGYKVCRYLFVRCDNTAAPWTSDEQGDRPRPLPEVKELKDASDITERKEKPAWDYDEQDGWKWIKPAPASRKAVITGKGKKQRKSTKKTKIPKGLRCLICRNVLSNPLTTPCAHNFCKPCLLGSFSNQSFVRERNREGGGKLRDEKIVKKCPSCSFDISDFLKKPEVDRGLMNMIELLQKKIEEKNTAEASEEGYDSVVSDAEGLEEDSLEEDSGKSSDTESTAKVGDICDSAKQNEKETSGGKDELSNEDSCGEKDQDHVVLEMNEDSCGEKDEDHVVLEMKEGGDKDDENIAAVDSLASHKRKKVVIARKSGKKGKQGEEVTTEDKTEDTSGVEDQHASVAEDPVLKKNFKEYTKGAYASMQQAGLQGGQYTVKTKSCFDTKFNIYSFSICSFDSEHHQQHLLFFSIFSLG